MAEYGIPYVLVTPAGSLSFNAVPTNQDGLYLSDIAGLDGGDVRGSTQNLPQRDGAYVFDSLRGAVFPTLTGFIRASTLAARTTIMDQLKAYTDSLRTADGTLKFTPSGVAQRQLNGVRLAAPVQIGNAEGVLKTFQLQLVAGNPYVVAAAASAGSFSSLVAAVGALVFPFSFPFTFGDNTSGLLSVTPGGNAPAWPVVTITGPITGPSVQNLTTGAQISLSTLALAAGDQLVIDTYNELVYVNAPTNSKIGFLDLAGSTFWPLSPGIANSLRVAGSSVGSGAAASIAYSDTYI